MATDPDIRNHQTWLGYLQPEGLVVSPAALVDAQVLPNQNAAQLQHRFLEHITEVGSPEESRLFDSGKKEKPRKKSEGRKRGRGEGHGNYVQSS